MVGSLLLSVGQDPESAFWLLVALTDRILYPGTYAPYLPGFQVWGINLSYYTIVSSRTVVQKRWWTALCFCYDIHSEYASTSH